MRSGFVVLGSSGHLTNYNAGKEIVKSHLIEDGLIKYSLQYGFFNCFILLYALLFPSPKCFVLG